MNHRKNPTNADSLQVSADLNRLVIPGDGSGNERALEDFSTESGAVRCYFRGIREALLGHIGRFDYMVGCIAWLTDPGILRALATREGVSIIVQKEDFLRPDSDARPDLRKLYEAIPARLARWDIDGVLNDMSLQGGGEPFDAIRCVGNHNASKSPAAARAHHKFLVFADREPFVHNGRDNWDAPCCIKPKAVWTGSFNFTVNAGRSLENAVLINDPVIARAYFNEFSQVAALSEPLDWQTPWCEPEWRIGT
jgi:phosphatidylserine/phosphatidylglycerophosphate/cardiolipin synthase-like enzyme